MRKKKGPPPPLDNELSEPELYITDCECGTKECDRFILAMINPSIKPIDDSEKLAAVLYVPVKIVPEIINQMLRYALKKGLKI